MAHKFLSHYYLYDFKFMLICIMFRNQIVMEYKSCSWFSDSSGLVSSVFIAYFHLFIQFLIFWQNDTQENKKKKARMLETIEKEECVGVKITEILQQLQRDKLNNDLKVYLKVE